jgi:NADH-ubiquinone oxidoreductase chain 5
MALPLALLAVPSIFIGFVTKDMIIGVGTDFWGNALFTLPQNSILLDAEFLPHSIKLLPVLLSLTGGITSFLLYTYGIRNLYEFKTSQTGRNLYNFLNRKWFFDKIYTEVIGQNILSFGYSSSYKAIDRGFIEMLGPFGLSYLINLKGRSLSNLQTGFVYHYAFVMLVGVTFILILIHIWQSIGFIIDPRLAIIFILGLFFQLLSDIN